MNDAPDYSFFPTLARVLNSGQSRSVLLCGHIHDLYFLEDTEDDSGGDYVPLLSYLCSRSSVAGLILLVYELNGPIRIHGDQGDALRRAWIAWQSGVAHDDLVLQGLHDRDKSRQREMLATEFDRNVQDAIGRPTVALEFLRQLTLCSRSRAPGGRRFLNENLLIIIEAADLMLPAGSGEISRLTTGDRHRINITHDWFTDPGFMNGEDSVVLLAESASQVHERITMLPSTLSVDVGAPDRIARRHYIEWFMNRTGQEADAAIRPGPVTPRPTLEGSIDDLAAMTAGLSVHALRQLLLGAAHTGTSLAVGDVVGKVQEHIASQLGDDVVEFKKPSHTLDDVVGFANLKHFINQELLPRFRATGPEALPGAAVAGPIGGGKTFIFEAAAGALGLPVLVLKNLRSQWYGQTDVIFERLRRVLEALGKVLIFVDEADTQFGGVGASTHATERRLTGKIQQMMSDPALRGRVIWLLMTARIHLLSPDIRRPGRVGDLIIPVLDPEGEDHEAFVRWVVEGVLENPDDATITELGTLTKGYSAAAFASLRSQLRARAIAGALDIDAVRHVLHDHIPPAIGLTRRYQTLQALINCTRRSLLPDPTISEESRELWQAEVRLLESQGIG